MPFNINALTTSIPFCFTLLYDYLFLILLCFIFGDFFIWFETINETRIVGSALKTGWSSYFWCIKRRNGFERASAKSQFPQTVVERHVKKEGKRSDYPGSSV